MSGCVELHEAVEERVVIRSAVGAGIREPSRRASSLRRRRADDAPPGEVERSDDELEPAAMGARRHRLDAQQEPLGARLEGQSPVIGEHRFAVHEVLERPANMRAARNEIFE